MNIGKEIKQYRKKVKKNSIEPFGVYLREKRVIAEFYRDYGTVLNEKDLVNRYNTLYSRSDNNPAGIKTVAISLLIGIVASLVYTSSLDNGGFIIVTINTIKDIAENFMPKYFFVSVILIAFLIIIALAFVLVPISFFIFWTNRNLGRDKLEAEINEYEITLIHDLLYARFQDKYNVRKISYTIKAL